jgi:hypothetical protein
MEEPDAAVNNLVGFLGEFAPHALEVLKARFPDSPLLEEGKRLGPLSAPLMARIEVALGGLDAMTRVSEATADKLFRTMRAASRWEFVGQLISLLGSGGVLAAILGKAGAAAQTASALIAFTGSAIALYVKFKRKDILDSDKGLLHVYGDLIRANGSAVELYGRLLPASLSKDDLGDVRELSEQIDKANRLAGELYSLLKSAGQSVPIRIERAASTL